MPCLRNLTLGQNDYCCLSRYSSSPGTEHITLSETSWLTPDRYKGRCRPPPPVDGDKPISGGVTHKSAKPKRVLSRTELCPQSRIPLPLLNRSVPLCDPVPPLPLCRFVHAFEIWNYIPKVYPTCIDVQRESLMSFPRRVAISSAFFVELALRVGAAVTNLPTRKVFQLPSEFRLFNTDEQRGAFGHCLAALLARIKNGASVPVFSRQTWRRTNLERLESYLCFLVCTAQHSTDNVVGLRINHVDPCGVDLVSFSAHLRYLHQIYLHQIRCKTTVCCNRTAVDECLPRTE